MRTLGIFGLLCTLSYNGPVMAMSWGELQQEVTAVESGRPANPRLIVRLAEIMMTLVEYTKAIAAESPQKRGLIFCLPAETTMHLDQVVSLVREYARNNEVAAETTVQFLLVSAFKQNYPCT